MPGHAMLGRDVGDQVRHGPDATDGRGVDDRARALRLEVWQRVLHPEEDALEIDRRSRARDVGRRTPPTGSARLRCRRCCRARRCARSGTRLVYERTHLALDGDVAAMVRISADGTAAAIAAAARSTPPASMSTRARFAPSRRAAAPLRNRGPCRPGHDDDLTVEAPIHGAAPLTFGRARGSRAVWGLGHEREDLAVSDGRDLRDRLDEVGILVRGGQGRPARCWRPRPPTGHAPRGGLR